MYAHSDLVPISQVEGTSSIPYSQLYSAVPDYVDVDTFKNGIPIDAGITASAVRETVDTEMYNGSGNVVHATKTDFGELGEGALLALV